MCAIIFPAVQILLPFVFIILNKYNSNALKLNGKVAVVTNGSNGLGQKICMTLAQYGCNIVIVDILPAHETLEKLKEYGDVKAKAFRANITNEHEVSKVMEDVIREFKTVDILINNTNLISHKTIFEHTDSDIERIISDKICGIKNMTNACLDIMKQNGIGNIITVAGVKGLTAYPFQIDLSCAKFKVLKFMNGLRKLLDVQGMYGIKITCFSPKEESLMNGEIDTTDYLTNDEYIKLIMSNIDNSIMSKLGINMI